MPIRFTHQFGYDQLYIGNSNSGLHFNGNLHEGEQAWYYFVAGGTGGTLILPQRTPNSYTALRFCTWYAIADLVHGYNVSITCIKDIKAWYNAQMNSKKHSLEGHKRVYQS